MDLVADLLQNAVIFSDSIGMVFFASVIFLTFKHKKLHSDCHLLVSIYSFFNFLSKSGNPLMALFQLPFMANSKFPFASSAIFCSLLVASIDGVFPLMLAISADRMSSALFPIWYSTTMDTTIHLCIVLAIVFIYLAFVLFSILQFAFAHSANLNSLVSFLPNLLIYSSTNSAFLYCELVFIFLTFCCYLAMALKVACAPGHQQTSSSTRKLFFKSMALILLLQVAGYLIALIGYSIVGGIEVNGVGDEQRNIMLENCVSFFLSIATTAEVPVLYTTSSNHRSAFKKEFGRLLRFFSKQPTSIQNSHPHHHHQQVIISHVDPRLALK